MGYKFKVGDRVRHFENDELGTITKLLTFDEDSGEPVDELDDELPHYNVKWDSWGEDEEPGFECEGNLEPVV